MSTLNEKGLSKATVMKARMLEILEALPPGKVEEIMSFAQYVLEGHMDKSVKKNDQDNDSFRQDGQVKLIGPDKWMMDFDQININ